MKRFQHLRTAMVLMIMSVMGVSWVACGMILLFIRVLGAMKPYLGITSILLGVIMFIISFVIGSLLTFVIAKHFLKPLHSLIQANRKIQSGDFTVRVSEEHYPAGEMYDLLHSFNLMASELEHIELYRSDFINNFSHEFKTPIVSIRGFAKQLKNADLTQEQRDEYLDIIISESEKLCNMSGNVLQMTKLENQSIVSDRTEFSLDEQIRNSVLLLEQKWSEKNIEMQIDLPNITINSNEDMLAQVWNNLLDNAIKFTSKNGTVGVYAHMDGDKIWVKVYDTGCGMSEETISHIFEKFYQGDSSHSKQGNGLGLPIVKRIVELCGGSITAESKPGEGASFTVCLPKE